MSRKHENLCAFGYAAFCFGFMVILLAGCQGEEVLHSSGPYFRAEVTPAQVVAGGAVTVQCTLVDAAGAATPAPSALILVDPAEGVEITGAQFVAKIVGTLRVRCADPTGVVQGSVPATVTVVPGAFAGTRVSFDPPIVPAGVYAKALCESVDAYDNAIPADASQFALKTAGDEQTAKFLHIEGSAAYGTRSGSYAFTCDLLTSQTEIATPGNLVVVPGAPTEIRFLLDPVKAVYELEETITVTADAYDAWGNRVEGTAVSAISVTPDEGGLTITNNTMETVEEGSYRLSAHLVDTPEITGAHEMLVDGFGPVIVVTSPEQALRLTGSPAALVEGTVHDSMGMVTHFAVNGQAMPVPDNGAFQVEIELADGINAVVVEATDAHGRNTRVVRWVLWSPEYQPISPDFNVDQNIDGGMQVRFGQNAVDDGDHNPMNPDDLATLFEISLAELSLEEMLGGLSWPILGDEGDLINYSLAFETAKQDPPSVALLLGDGHLAIQIELERIHIEGNLEPACITVGSTLTFEFCILPTVKLATIDIDKAVITATLVPHVDAETSEVTFEVLETESQFYGLIIEGNGDLAGAFDGINGLVNSELKIFLEQYLADTIKDELGAALHGLIQGWQISTTLEVPSIFGGEGMEMLFESKLTEITVSKEALVLSSAVMVQDPALRVSDPVGAFLHGACGADDIPTVDELQLGLKDALINRSVHLLWSNGLLDASAQLSANTPKDALCGFGGVVRLLDADANTSVHISATPLLPPVLNSCAVMSENDEDFGLQFGPVQVELIYVRGGQKAELSFQMGFGAPMGQKDGSVELGLGVPTDTQVNWLDNSGITRLETKALVEGLDDAVTDHLAPGMAQCVESWLSYGPINAQAFVPAVQGLSLVPVFDELSHQAQTLWINGTFQ